MNSREALELIEREVVAGRFRRLEGSEKTSHGILYRTLTGKLFGLEIGNATASWAQADNGVPYLKLANDAKTAARTQLVLQRSAMTPGAWEQLADVEGVELRDGQLNSTVYKTRSAEIDPGQQQLAYADTQRALLELLSRYDEASPAPAGMAALSKLRDIFVARYPDFEIAGGFAAPSGSYHTSFRSRVDALLASAASHPQDGWAVLQDVMAASQAGRGALPPFLDGDTNWRTPRARAAQAATFDAALHDLVASASEPAAAIAAFNDMFWPALGGLGADKPFRDTRIVPSTVLAAVAPDRAISVRYTAYSEMYRLLGGQTLFANGPMSAAEYRNVLDLAERIRSALQSWGWKPRDLWDVNGFVLATCGERPSEQSEPPPAPWFVTARDGDGDGLAGFVERGEWHLAEGGTGRAGESVRAMQAGDRIVMRDYFHQVHDLPFDAGGRRVSAMRLRAIGTVTGQREGGVSVDWAVLPAPRTWYFYTNNDPVWRPPVGDELAGRLIDFTLHDVPQDYDWFVAHWFGSDRASPVAEETAMPEPTNLILHGPPGTGKTYATAAEAVRLCGEEVPKDREALMARYRALLAEERIAFVTFHQTMAYEDFVEGLRPVQKAGEAGFTLEPRPGIFRRIAEAAGATPERREAAPFDPAGRAVYKLSLGDIHNPDEAHIFEDCTSVFHDAAIGFGDDIDFSPAYFADKGAILNKLTTEGAPKPSYQASQLHTFRNKIEEGDLIVVAAGNLKYRAIGVVEGPYLYDEERDASYPHRRAVRWLLVAPQGRPVQEILATNFQQQTTYRLPDASLKWDRLAELLGSGEERTTPTVQPYVLIIDEINRANISKVFGELITLIEPDKRIGMVNELRLTLPYSEIADFGVPANLHIIGTMNTADRSIALIDKALRRRFTFREMMPDYELDAMTTPVAGAGVTLAALLRAINDRIEYLLDREHQIGHAWLLGCTTKDRLDAAMRDRIIPLIAEYFFEDWGRTADVLGGREDNPFLHKIALSPPPGLKEQETRYRWVPRETFDTDAYLRCIAGA